MTQNEPVGIEEPVDVVEPVGVEDHVGSVEAVESDVVKRSRGRPKKRKANSIETETNEIQIKRKRGRPPKAKSALDFNKVKLF